MKPTPAQLDAISELINIGVGRAAGILNEMTGSPIELVAPEVKLLLSSELADALEDESGGHLAVVRLPFGGSIHGTAALIFPPRSAAQLVAVLTREEPGTPDLDSVRAGTLSEVGNIVINGVMGSIGNILQMPLVYELPAYFEGSPERLLEDQLPHSDPPMLLAHAHFQVRDLRIRGSILLVWEVQSFDALLDAVDRIGGAD